MINIKHYQKEIDDLEPGERARINHVDCEAGQDTRRRLYIERSYADPTSVVYYCHNCQQGGRASNDKYQTYRDTRHHATPSTPQLEAVVEEPAGTIHKLDDWPTAAKIWAFNNSLTSNLCYAWGIAYDPNTNKIYIPRYDIMQHSGGNGELIGYQLRLIEGRGAKYTTVQTPDSNGWTAIAFSEDTTELRHAVIVEDYVSAIHVAEAIGANDRWDMEDWIVCVNYGTKINTHMLYYISDCTTLDVWLDNDSQHVVNQAKHIARTAKLFGVYKAQCIDEELTDPKHYTQEEIQDALNG